MKVTAGWRSSVSTSGSDSTTDVMLWVISNILHRYIYKKSTFILDSLCTWMNYKLIILLTYQEMYWADNWGSCLEPSSVTRACFSCLKLASISFFISEKALIPLKELITCCRDERERRSWEITQSSYWQHSMNTPTRISYIYNRKLVCNVFMTPKVVDVLF